MRDDHKEELRKWKYIRVDSIECQDGWFRIINSAFSFIERLLMGTNSSVSFQRIRESHGALRFTTRFMDVDEDFRKSITSHLELCENISCFTCELCGQMRLIEKWDGRYCPRCTTVDDIHNS